MSAEPDTGFPKEKDMATMTDELRPLAAMVRNAHKAGTSFREMEKRAKRAGKTISHSQLAAYEQDSVTKMPDVQQLHALAAALDTGYEAVRSAAFQQWYGYEPREISLRPSGSRIAAAIPGDLTPEEEAELTRMVRAWAAARRADRDE